MGRPSRADEIRANRRMKPGSVNNPGIKLSVDEKKLDRDNFEYRFANDRDGRIDQLYQRDWDVVKDEDAKPDSNSVGSLASAHAGTADGKPFNAVLMRKPKVLFEDDMKARQKPLDEMDEAIRGGKNHETIAEGLKGANVYTPNGVNIIER